MPRRSPAQDDRNVSDTQLLNWYGAEKYQLMTYLYMLTRAALLGNQVENLNSSRTLLNELFTEGAVL